jgi:hypothetical protein
LNDQIGGTLFFPRRTVDQFGHLNIFGCGDIGASVHTDILGKTTDSIVGTNSLLTLQKVHFPPIQESFKNTYHHSGVL